LRFQDLSGREIVNLYNGMRLGDIGDCDLLVDDKTGKIEFLMIPNKKNQFAFFSDRSWIEIPWEAVKRIGSDLVIVEVESQRGSLF
jgi:YlmC/YmxH family sporulation protein